MMRTSLWLLLFSSSTVLSAPPDFDREVAPILAEHCFSCHTGPKPKGDLDLSSKAKVLASGQIVPGNADKSELWD
ncbi:MAG: c-type cytochrome domain-containing protein, partial [Gemmataceae bacterium]